MNSSVRNITAFVIILAAGIYFLRPAGTKPAVIDLTVAAPVEDSLKNTKLKALITPGARIPRAPSSAVAKSQPNSAQAPSAKSLTATRSEKEALIADLHATKKCYQSETCAFPKTDPRSYSFAVSRRIADDLTEFQKKFAKDDAEQARALALEFANNDDGFVQEAALKLLSPLPPSQEAARAVAHVVTETTDPSIVHQAMDELKRYVGTQEEAQVHQALGRVLSTGGMLTSQQASQGLLPFLNPSSVGYYQKVLRTLPPDSEVARNLKVSLQEYQRISTGG